MEGIHQVCWKSEGRRYIFRIDFIVTSMIEVSSEELETKDGHSKDDKEKESDDVTHTTNGRLQSHEDGTNDSKMHEQSHDSMDSENFQISQCQGSQISSLISTRTRKEERHVTTSNDEEICEVTCAPHKRVRVHNEAQDDDFWRHSKPV